jgi:hypothetical protein
VKPGDQVRFRTGRNGITKDFIWDTGLILEVYLDDFGDKCKILDSGGRIKWIRSRGTVFKVLNQNETR